MPQRRARALCEPYLGHCARNAKRGHRTDTVATEENLAACRADATAVRWVSPRFRVPGQMSRILYLQLQLSNPDIA